MTPAAVDVSWPPPSPTSAFCYLELPSISLPQSCWVSSRRVFDLEIRPSSPISKTRSKRFAFSSRPSCCRTGSAGDIAPISVPVNSTCPAPHIATWRWTHFALRSPQLWGRCPTRGFIKTIHSGLGRGTSESYTSMPVPTTMLSLAPSSGESFLPYRRRARDHGPPASRSPTLTSRRCLTNGAPGHGVSARSDATTRRSG